MSAAPIRVYTTSWCGDCFRAKSFLDHHGIAYQEIDIEKTEGAAETVMRVNSGRRRVPTFEVKGEFFGNPPITELARIVGIVSETVAEPAARKRVPR